ncbi:Triosephosphate isomerase [Naviculisporaceae sp. PSN 640]
MSSSPAPARPPTKRIVGVSTKMYFSFARTTSFVSSFLSQLESLSESERATIAIQSDVFIIPDHVSLTSVISQAMSAPSPMKVLVGAQDCYSEDSGAFTGEVSPSVVAEVGCRIVELGHAERRRLFGETDETTALKAAAVVRNGMVPLVCVGEISAPSSSGSAGGEGDVSGLEKAVAEVMVQVRSVLAALPDNDAEVILAYEPVWAIGASEPAGVDHVLSVARRIRASEEVRRRKEGSLRILYGGSAGPGLFEKLKGELDGLFLGRFAHDPEQFLKTIREVAEA